MENERASATHMSKFDMLTPYFQQPARSAWRNVCAEQELPAESTPPVPALEPAPPSASSSSIVASVTQASSHVSTRSPYRAADALSPILQRQSLHTPARPQTRLRQPGLEAERKEAQAHHNDNDNDNDNDDDDDDEDEDNGNDEITEEVTESPPGKPGSGVRRSLTRPASNGGTNPSPITPSAVAVAASAAAASTARSRMSTSLSAATRRLQEEVTAHEQAGLGVSSSPSLRHARWSAVHAQAHTRPVSLAAGDAEHSAAGTRSSGHSLRLKLQQPPNNSGDDADDIVEDDQQRASRPGRSLSDEELSHDRTIEILLPGQDVLARSRIVTSPIIDSVPLDELAELTQLSPTDDLAHGQAQEGEDVEEDEPSANTDGDGYVDFGIDGTDAVASNHDDGDGDVAEEIGDVETAKALGQRRRGTRSSLSVVPPPENHSPPKTRGRRKRKAREREVDRESSSPAEVESSTQPQARRGHKRKGRSRTEDAAALEPADDSLLTEIPSLGSPPTSRTERESELRPAKPLAKRGRKRKAAEEAEPEPEESTALVDGDAAPSPPANRGGRRAKKARKDVATTRKSRTTTAASTTKDDHDSNSGNGIQITVQRFAGPPPGPRVVVMDSDSDSENSSRSSADELACGKVTTTDMTAFRDRRGVTVVDVVAQMCEELVTANIEALEARLQEANGKEGADKVTANSRNTRQVIKTQLKALCTFREELHTRLLPHALALDELAALEARTREATRRRATLRAEILALRQERYDLALRKDGLRDAWERDKQVTMRRLALSTALHDIDLALDTVAGSLSTGSKQPVLDKKMRAAADVVNLELAVKSIAELVSSASASGGGGQLRSLRDFNRFLERAAVALERRQSRGGRGIAA